MSKLTNYYVFMTTGEVKYVGAFSSISKAFEDADLLGENYWVSSEETLKETIRSAEKALLAAKGDQHADR